MRYLYNILVIIIIIYMIIKVRRPDFLDVYAASSIVYYLPLSLGVLLELTINSAPNRIEISPSLYLFGILNLLVTFFWMLIKDHVSKFKYNVNNKSKETRITSHDNTLILIGCMLLLMMSISVYKNIDYLFGSSFNKVLFIQNVSALETVCRYLGLYLATYTFTRKKCNKLLVCISLIYILYGLLMGRRSDSVLLVIMIFVYRLSQSSEKPHSIVYYLKKHKMIFSLVFITAILVFPIKRSLPVFISGNFISAIKYTFQCMFDINTYLVSEPNSITLYVSKVLDEPGDMLFKPYLFDLLSIVPFGNTLTNNWIYNNSFDVYFQQTYFPEITKDIAGLAGSFWAENYVNNLWIGMFFSMNILLWIICCLEKKIMNIRNSIYMPFLLIFLVHLSFYIHRLFLSHIFNVGKYLIFVAILVFFVDKIVKLRKIIQ